VPGRAQPRERVARELAGDERAGHGGSLAASRSTM
jgi:hypothetical protein